MTPDETVPPDPAGRFAAVSRGDLAVRANGAAAGDEGGEGGEPMALPSGKDEVSRQLAAAVDIDAGRLTAA